MKSVATRFGRMSLVVLLAGLGLVGGSSPASMPAAKDGGSQLEAVTSLRPEVRLRKLHLVRPDLIQYPLAYDIYC